MVYAVFSKRANILDKVESAKLGVSVTVAFLQARREPKDEIDPFERVCIVLSSRLYTTRD